MSMILPYHDIATAAAFAEVSVCSTRAAKPSAGPAVTPHISPCCAATSVYMPTRWAKLVGTVLAPISGPTLSRPGNGASNT